MKKRILSTILAVALTVSTAVTVLPTVTASAAETNTESSEAGIEKSEETDQLAGVKIVNSTDPAGGYWVIDWVPKDISYKTNPNISYIVVLSGQLPIYTKGCHACVKRTDKEQTAFVVTRYTDPSTGTVYYSKDHSETVKIPTAAKEY